MKLFPLGRKVLRERDSAIVTRGPNMTHGGAYWSCTILGLNSRYDWLFTQIQKKNKKTKRLVICIGCRYLRLSFLFKYNFILRSIIHCIIGTKWQQAITDWDKCVATGHSMNQRRQSLLSHKCISLDVLISKGLHPDRIYPWIDVD